MSSSNGGIYCGPYSSISSDSVSSNVFAKRLKSCTINSNETIAKDIQMIAGVINNLETKDLTAGELQIVNPVDLNNYATLAQVGQNSATDLSAVNYEQQDPAAVFGTSYATAFHYILPNRVKELRTVVTMTGSNAADIGDLSITIADASGTNYDGVITPVTIGTNTKISDVAATHVLSGDGVPANTPFVIRIAQSIAADNQAKFLFTHQVRLGE